MVTGRSLALLVVVAVLLIAPSGTVGLTPRPLDHAPAPIASPPLERPGPEARPDRVASNAPSGSGALVASSRATIVRNVMVDVPCNSSANAEVEQAFDPALGYLYEAWIGCGGIGFSRSVDGGFSFQPAFTVPGSAPTGGSSWDPSIAVAPNGTIYVAFMVSVPGDTPVVAWSWDHGQSFAGSAEVFAPPANTFSDRDFLAVAPNGTLYVTWDYSPQANWPNGSSLDVIGCAPAGSCYFTNGDYNIVIAWSTNGGANWSGFVPVVPEYPWGGAPCGPLLVSPNGTIDVLFEDYNVSGPTHALGLGYNYFSRSFDGGRNWTAPVRISSYSFLNTVWWIDGAIARDTSGTLYATYDSVNATADTAWVALSRDGGASWSPSIRVNPDANSAAHNLVGGAGGENGTVYVAWMSNASGSQSAFEAALGGNGSTWGPVMQVSNLPGAPPDWIGDTLGVTYLGSGRVAVSWSYGVNQSGLLASQVFAAVLGEAPPGAPNITLLLPGRAEATVDWAAPTAPAPVTGYLIAWGLEGNLSHNASVAPTVLSFVLPNLTAFAHYQVVVTAFNGAGLGPTSPLVAFTLFAWTHVDGSVAPAAASVSLDGGAVAVVGGHFSVNTSYAPHLVTARATDHQTSALAVVPAWNATAWANFSLTLIPGTVAGILAPVTSNLTWNGAAEPVGASGFFSFSVAPGTTGLLAVRFPGLIPWERNVTVPANVTVWENVTLIAPNATLHLHLAPPTAALWVDRISVAPDAGGNATLSLVGGSHRLEVTARSYFPYFVNLTLRPGQIANLTVNLTMVPVVTNPNGSGSAAPNPFSDPLVLGLLAGVVALALVIVVLGRRGRRLPPPPEPVDGEGDEIGAPELRDDGGVPPSA